MRTYNIMRYAQLSAFNIKCPLSVLDMPLPALNANAAR
jgi:hypothetical protein